MFLSLCYTAARFSPYTLNDLLVLVRSRLWQSNAACSAFLDVLRRLLHKRICAQQSRDNKVQALQQQLALQAAQVHALQQQLAESQATNEALQSVISAMRSGSGTPPQPPCLPQPHPQLNETTTAGGSGVSGSTPSCSSYPEAPQALDSPATANDNSSSADLFAGQTEQLLQLLSGQTWRSSSGSCATATAARAAGATAAAMAPEAPPPPASSRGQAAHVPQQAAAPLHRRSSCSNADGPMCNEAASRAAEAAVAAVSRLKLPKQQQDKAASIAALLAVHGMPSSGPAQLQPHQLQILLTAHKDQLRSALQKAIEQQHQKCRQPKKCPGSAGVAAPVPQQENDEEQHCELGSSANNSEARPPAAPAAAAPSKPACPNMQFVAISSSMAPASLPVASSTCPIGSSWLSMQSSSTATAVESARPAACPMPMSSAAVMSASGSALTISPFGTEGVGLLLPPAAPAGSGWGRAPAPVTARPPQLQQQQLLQVANQLGLQQQQVSLGSSAWGMATALEGSALLQSPAAVAQQEQSSAAPGTVSGAETGTACDRQQLHCQLPQQQQQRVQASLGDHTCCSSICSTNELAIDKQCGRVPAASPDCMDQLPDTETFLEALMSRNMDW